MEKLLLRSDGVTETPTGLRAIVMFYRMRDDGVRALFNFKSHTLGDTITIQWPSDSDVALLPAETSAAVVANNYARYLSAEEVEQYNAIVDATLSGQETPAVLIPAAGDGSLIESQVESSDDTVTPVPDLVITPVPPSAVDAGSQNESLGVVPSWGAGEGSVPTPAPVPMPHETASVTPPAPPSPVPVPPPVAVPPAEPTGKGKAK